MPTPGTVAAYGGTESTRAATTGNLKVVMTVQGTSESQTVLQAHTVKLVWGDRKDVMSLQCANMPQVVISNRERKDWDGIYRSTMARLRLRARRFVVHLPGRLTGMQIFGPSSFAGKV